MKTFRFIAMIAVVTPLLAQMNEQEVRARLDLIHSGKSEDVRSEIPALMRRHPNDPGVKYIDAYLTVNGDQAVRKYQAIVDQFPKSEWADDALFRVYKYYYAVGLYKTAEAKLNQLNEQYPTSIFAKRQANLDEKTVIAPPAAETTSVEPKQETVRQDESPAMQSRPPGAFAVQVGVYSQESTAQQQARQVTAAVGRRAVVFPKVSGGKTVYAVAFEGFDNEASARSFGAQLKSNFNIDWFMVKR